MGFKTGAYAKVWKLEDKGRFTSAQISVSKKNKETDKYETDFSGFVALVGHAHNKASQISEGDRFQIGNCDVTTKYDAEKKITYTNYTIFDFEPSGGQGAPQASQGGYETTEDPDEMPF